MIEKMKQEFTNVLLVNSCFKYNPLQIQQIVHNIKYPIIHRNIQPEGQGKQKNDFTKQWETFSSEYTNF